MLVLSREIGELITIGDTISLRVVAVNEDTVRIGIEAPRCVIVHRAEVYARIQRKRDKQKQC